MKGITQSSRNSIGPASTVVIKVVHLLLCVVFGQIETASFVESRTGSAKSTIHRSQRAGAGAQKVLVQGFIICASTNSSRIIK